MPDPRDPDDPGYSDFPGDQPQFGDIPDDRPNEDGADPINFDNVVDINTLWKIQPADWLKNLKRNRDGILFPIAVNVVDILNNAAEYAGLFGFSDFVASPYLMKPPPGVTTHTDAFPRTWSVADIVAVQASLQRHWITKVSRETVADCMLHVAQLHPFHPVRDYLRALVWDGTPRLHTWLVHAFGVRETAFAMQAGAMFLIAGVRRIFYPGTKFDHMLIIEGLQDIGKSYCFRELAILPAWFSDDLPIKLMDKDSRLGLLGRLIIEFAEIEHLVRNETETVKSFISRQTDIIRPPYGRSMVEFPRQCILCGTTNNSEFLRDETGNRRFWCFHATKADHGWVTENRDMLWAEAVWHERHGYPIWLSQAFDPTAYAESIAEQQYRLMRDIWHDRVADWVFSRNVVTVAEILSDQGCIGMPVERQNQGHVIRIGKILSALGWIKAAVRNNSGPYRKNRKYWRRPGAAAPPEADEGG